MQSVVEYPFEFERPDAGGGTVTHIKFVPSDECLVSPLVRVENVPDGTSARIEVYHCRTNQLVSGGTLDGLEVRSGKVVRPSTNAEPKLTFRYGQEPWHLWDKPFFYFKAYVHFRGLRVQTPADFENEGNNCLRVRYWHVCIGFTGDAIAPSVQSKCNTVKGFFDGVQHSCSTIQHFTSYNHAEAAFGSFFRNSYAVFSDSHGTLVQRSDNWTLCPNHDYSAPPNLNRGDWKSVVCFTPQPYIDAADVSNAQYFVSVPRYLYYISACLSGWEPSLANAFISRGCMHVIAYGKVIYTDKGEQMARRFFDRWTNTYHLAPDKIADAFLHAGSGLRDDLRPILYPAGTEIPSGGLSGWAIAGIVLGALAIVAVGVLVGAALLGLL
jgi:hypothetical protein